MLPVWPVLLKVMHSFIYSQIDIESPVRFLYQEYSSEQDRSVLCVMELQPWWTLDLRPSFNSKFIVFHYTKVSMWGNKKKHLASAAAVTEFHHWVENKWKELKSHCKGINGKGETIVQLLLNSPSFQLSMWPLFHF